MSVANQQKNTGLKKKDDQTNKQENKQTSKQTSKPSN